MRMTAPAMGRPSGQMSGQAAAVPRCAKASARSQHVTSADTSVDPSWRKRTASCKGSASPLRLSTRSVVRRGGTAEASAASSGDASASRSMRSAAGTSTRRVTPHCASVATSCAGR
eukprot:1487291-Prymnesium_polylepis.1